MKRKSSMPKHKLEQAATGDGTGEQPTPKRLRPPLNFSIESIMQPAAAGQERHSCQQMPSSPESSPAGSPLGMSHSTLAACPPSREIQRIPQFQQQRSSRANGLTGEAGSRSPSRSPSSRSEASSNDGSEASQRHRLLNAAAATGTSNNNSHHHQDQQAESLASPSSASSPQSSEATSALSSRVSSRVSSPISPGCNSRPGTPLEMQSGNSTSKTSPLGATESKFSATGGQLNGTSTDQANSSTNTGSNQENASAQQARGQTTQHHQSSQQHRAGGSANGSSNGHRLSASGGSSSKRTSGGGHHSASSRIKPVCTDARLAPFECRLDNLELWHRFYPLDTEMIITKQGRRMFPPVRVTFAFNEQLLQQQQQQQQAACNQQAPQFNPRDKYQVLMDILPYDNKRYRYAYHKSSWQQAGKADPLSPTKLFQHPDGPFTLDQLKRQVISFEKIKLTNNDENKHGYIVLNSMHKYQPRIHLTLWRGKESPNLANAPSSLLEAEAHKTFIFSETIFTAVTAYQNHSITKLKIDSNPFAKGFRDSTRLTDLELESMQDLIADGQCPFSPPRAPPPGFSHFLFAAAAQQQQPQQFPGALHAHPHNPHQAAFAGGVPHQQFGAGNGSGPCGGGGGGGGNGSLGPIRNCGGGGPLSKMSPGEDAATALLRERTLMALDSFLQQQQQQQHRNQHNQQAESPHQLSSGKPAQPQLSSDGVSSPSQLQQQQQSSPVVSSAGLGVPPTSAALSQFNPAILANAFLLSGGTGLPQGPPSPYSLANNQMAPHSLPPPPPPPSLSQLSQPSPQQTLAQQAHPPPPPHLSSQSQGQLEQFIIQQQRQFAAAMAAAATGAVQQHPAYLQSLFTMAQQQQQHQQHQHQHQQQHQSQCSNGPQPDNNASQPSANGAVKLPTGSVSPPANAAPAAPLSRQTLGPSQMEQTSPIGLAKSANRMQLELNQFLASQQQQQQATHMSTKHSYAILQQQQQMQQMAALAQQHLPHLPAHHPLLQQTAAGGGGCLQVEPLLALQNAAVISRTKMGGKNK